MNFPNQVSLVFPLTLRPYIILSSGNGNSISTANAENGNSGLNSTSYGISVCNKISNKFKVRSGIHQVNLNDNLQNLPYSTLSSSVINTDFANNAPGIPIENSAAILVQVDQAIGFLEVPAEIEYFILNKKLSISLITGFSTLFLNKNKISIDSEDFYKVNSKVKNLNNFSFTANLGMGLKYQISPQFQFGLEPIYKHQMATFKNTTNFKPYYFGFYSGLSFKF